MLSRSLAALILVAATLPATGASAQTGAPGGSAGSPGGQLLGEGFFSPTAVGGGVGSGAVGSPINTNPGGAGIGLFGPGGFFAEARPMTATSSTPGGAQLVDSPATGNGAANASASGGATAKTPRLGGVGPRRFF